MSEDTWRWHRKDGDVAVLFDGSLADKVSPVFEVEQGTTGLLFCGGKITEVLGEGRYDLSERCPKKGFLGGRPPYKVLVAEAGWIRTRFVVDGLRTMDKVVVKLECEATVRIDDPGRFFLNLFKGRQSLHSRELGEALSWDVRNALVGVVKGVSIKDLAFQPNTRELLDSAGSALAQALGFMGMSLEGLKILSASNPGFDALTGKEEDRVIQIWEKESALEGRKRFFDVATEEEIQALAESAKEAELAEQRLDVLARTRKAVLRGEFERIRDEEEFAAFLDEQDTGRLLRQKTKDELKRTFAEEKEDHDLARRHVLEKLALERDFELKQMKLTHESRLEMDLLEHRHKLENMELDHRIDQEKKVANETRIKDLQDYQDELDKALKAAENDKEREMIRLEVKRAKSELGLLNLRQIKEIKIWNEKEKMLISLQEEEKRLELELKRQRQEHEQHLEYLKAISELGPEAMLASIKNPEVAALLADTYKAKLRSGMNEGQILAEAAARSPEVAKAFQEKFKGQSSGDPMAQVTKIIELVNQFKGQGADEIKQLYERMVSVLLEDKTAVREDMRDIARDAVSAPRQAGPAGRDVASPAGESGLSAGGYCSGCGKWIEKGSNFCRHCGTKI